MQPALQRVRCFFAPTPKAQHIFALADIAMLCEDSSYRLKKKEHLNEYRRSDRHDRQAGTRARADLRGLERDARRAPAPGAHRGRTAEALGSAPPPRSRQSRRP